MLCFAVVLFLSGMAFSETIHVPGDQPTIQAGIDAASAGDTVLVQPNTYMENIDFKGENIIVGSLFLTTGDTSYISQTVIDGYVGFSTGEDSTAVLCGFTVTNINNFTGAKVQCYGSGPKLEGLIIDGNNQGGPGLVCTNANPTVIDSKILNNSELDGGGICCSGSDLTLINVIVSNNDAFDPENMGLMGSGGGMACWGSNVVMRNVVFEGNQAETSGGGFDLWGTDVEMENVVISENRANGGGGGISCSESNLTMKHVTIHYNNASNGGGINSYNSNLNFSFENRCNIYWNYAATGSEIYIGGENTISVVVDTFTVLNPTDHHICPLNKCTYNILHAKLIQFPADLYVSPSGDDSNSGLTPSESLKSIRVAIEKVLTDSLNPRTIFLDEGNYSTSTTSEIFPITMKNYLTLEGDSNGVVTINAAGSDRVFHFSNIDGVNINHVTITRGAENRGGGIYCIHSSLNLKNVNIQGNHAFYYFIEGPPGFVEGYGGGIYCSESQINVENSAICENRVEGYGGGIYCSHSTVHLRNVSLCKNEGYDFSAAFNTVPSSGGGIYISSSTVDFENVTISGNTLGGMGGGIAHSGDVLTLKNVTVSGNRADWGGSGIYQNGGSLYLVNTIVWDNIKEEIHLPNENNTITIAYSDIEGGVDSVIVEEGNTVYWLDGNIDADPFFIEPDSSDFHLQEESPCIDAGTAFFTWQGDTIIDLHESTYNGEAPDMGAFESVYTSVQKGLIAVPKTFSLAQNFPNPFNPETTIAYQLPKANHVRLIVYNMLGQEVRTLVDDVQDMGFHQIVWNGKDNRGIKVPSGLYAILMDCGTFVQSRKIVLMR